MKKYVFMIAIMAMATMGTLHAQTTVHSPSAGSIAANPAQLDGITNLKLTGTVDASDFGAIVSKLKNTLVAIDLRELTTIEAYTGDGGPGSSLGISAYPKDGLPVGCFNRFVKLETVHLPDFLKSIGNMAFLGTGKLQQLTIPSGLQEIEGDRTFSESGITSLALPDNVQVSLVEFLNQRLLSFTFEYAKIKSFRVPASVTHIDAAFLWSELTELTFEENSSLVSAESFYGMPVAELVFPEGMKEFGVSGMLEKLTLIDFPSTLEAIGTGAGPSSLSDNVPLLRTVICRAIIPPTRVATRPVFNQDIYDNATLYVPAEAVDYYKEPGTIWSGFKNVKAIGGGDAEIEGFENITIEKGQTIELNATLKDENDTREIRYSIKEPNDKVATIENNVVTATGEGSVVIVALAEGSLDFKEVKAEITLAVADYSWLKAPAIAVHGSTAKVVGPADAVKDFTKFYIGTGEVADFDNDNGANLSATPAGTVTLKATNTDGSQVIRLVISRQ